jgi:hypothetical protein
MPVRDRLSFLGLFIANRVLGLDVKMQTPAVKMADGIEYVQTDKYVLFGAFRRWYELLHAKTTVMDPYGLKVLEVVQG